MTDRSPTYGKALQRDLAIGVALDSSIFHPSYAQPMEVRWNEDLEEDGLAYIH